MGLIPHCLQRFRKKKPGQDTPQLAAGWFIVCTGKPTMVEEVVEEICKQLPYDVTVEHLEGTPGD